MLLAQQPWERWSVGDLALHQLFGHLIADGKVPYRDFFDQKTPLAWYLNAAADLISRPLGVDYVLAARVLSVSLAAAGTVGLYLVARAASLGRGASAVAALLFIAFDYHSYAAIHGIEPKLLNSYIGIFALLAAYRSRWLLSGVLCALAFLAWPPGGVFLLGAGTVALMNGRATVREAIPRLVVGFVAPVAALLIYLGLVGALADFWADTFTFNRQYVSQEFSWLRVDLMADRINSGHASDRWLFLVGALGFVAWAWLFTFARDIVKQTKLVAPLAVVTLAVLGYSYVNFWTVGDVMPFLPWVAFWGAWLLERMARQPRWAPAAGVAALVLLGYGFHSLPDLTEVGNPPDEMTIVRDIEQRAHLQPGDPIYVQEEQWYLLLSGRDHLSRYYFLRNGTYKYAEEREGTYEAVSGPVIERKPKLFVMTTQANWLTQSGWTPLQRIFGPVLLDSYMRLDPQNISSGFSGFTRRAEFWVLRPLEDYQSGGTNLLERWQAQGAALAPSDGGTLVTSQQETYAVSEHVTPFRIAVGRGATYAAIAWVKGTDLSAGEAVSIAISEEGGAEGVSSADFKLTSQWQPVVVIHNVGQVVPEGLTVRVTKARGSATGDSFLVREGQLRLLVPGQPE